MPSVAATVTIPAPVEIAYRYLRERYRRGTFHRAATAAKAPRVCAQTTMP